MSKAEKDVLAERQRQIEVEGWSHEHDDKHRFCELGNAASCYSNPDALRNDPPINWPWRPGWWKYKSYRENLVRDGALIIAEIERLDRAEK